MSNLTPADMKAILAQHGQTMHPDAKVAYLDRPKPDTEGAVVALDRVQEGVTPPYCTHGYATCVRCEFPCWIGHATEKLLLSGEAMPICLPCAREVIPQESLAHPIARMEDHLRADGPHE